MKHSDKLAALAQTSPAGLALATDRSFQLTDHLELIDAELVEAIARARSTKRDRPEILLVEVPPRHGKSTLISQYAPAWYLGTFPERRVILASYEADFAASWGMRARDVLDEHGEALFGVSLSRTSRSANRWDLARHKGGMHTAGVGGAITGKGAHLLVIDDPIKNAEQAMSETVRKKQWDWWLSTTRSRLEPGAVVVVLMTRWHEADLGGRLLQAALDGGDRVCELRLPALAEQADRLGRAPGEALWPERYACDYLEHTREAVGAYWFSAMYQGSPSPDEGGIFRRDDLRYFELDGDGESLLLRQPDGTKKRIGLRWCAKATFVDLAVSEKETADYTVALHAWATQDGDLLIDEVYRDRIPGPDQADFLETHRAGVLKIESIGYQASLIQQLRRRGVPVEAVHPDKDKVTRASAAGALYRAGKVYHRAGATWLADFERELLAFPVGEHDDQVDALAYAAREVASLRPRAHRRNAGRGQTITGGLLTREL